MTEVGRIEFPTKSLGDSPHQAKIDALEQESRELNRCLTGMRHYLKVAAEYKNDDPAKLLAGIQAALLKASEYEPRTQKRRGRR